MFQIFCKINERVLLGEDTKGTPLTCTNLALFLFTQLYVRQPSKPVSEDTWFDKTTPTSPASQLILSPSKRLMSNQFISEETSRTKFILDDLDGLLALVFGKIDMNNYIIPFDMIDDFQFLFSGGFTCKEEVVHLSDLVPNNIRKEEGVIAKNFKNWLGDTLKVYDPSKQSQLTEKNVLIPNIQKTHVDRPLVIQNVAKSLYNPTPSHNDSSQICIYDCLRSHIFLLRDAKFVHISGCQKCLIMIGCVSKAITVQNCEDCRIITICRRLRVAYIILL